MALRQWTVRYASHTSHFCFVLRFRPQFLPEITEADLHSDKKGQETPVESPPVFDHASQVGTPEQEKPMPPPLPVLPLVQVSTPMPSLSAMTYPSLPPVVVHPPIPVPVPVPVPVLPSRPAANFKAKRLAFDLSCFHDEDEPMRVHELKPSFSSECLSGYESDDVCVWAGPWNAAHPGMPRSRSTKWVGRDFFDEEYELFG
jgi:hypothetical protein